MNINLPYLLWPRTSVLRSSWRTRDIQTCSRRYYTFGVILLNTLKYRFPYHCLNAEVTQNIRQLIVIPFQAWYFPKGISCMRFVRFHPDTPQSRISNIHHFCSSVHSNIRLNVFHIQNTHKMRREKEFINDIHKHILWK